MKVGISSTPSMYQYNLITTLARRLLSQCQRDEQTEDEGMAEEVNPGIQVPLGEESHDGHEPMEGKHGAEAPYQRSEELAAGASILPLRPIL